MEVRSVRGNIREMTLPEHGTREGFIASPALREGAALVPLLNYKRRSLCSQDDQCNCNGGLTPYDRRDTSPSRPSRDTHTSGYEFFFIECVIVIDLTIGSASIFNGETWMRRGGTPSHFEVPANHFRSAHKAATTKEGSSSALQPQQRWNIISRISFETQTVTVNAPVHKELHNHF
ncbi:hypothetical protein PROFUN_05504 [Planoprotostelium fungivorum]|uniref:Uncharacterized protein n=1 Tax=Planoprotostelium fungivorum TaxID=1890364 RepID=A0A2P6NQY2_9EUKA|nr:hypothetical protein PROFUN_05504 [Planoprotostelium fungivorum]